MNTPYTIHRVNQLPDPLVANGFYYVASTVPGEMELWITGKTNQAVRRLINRADIETLITGRLAANDTLYVVNTLAERNLIVPTANTLAYVQNASPDVPTGGLLYAYDMDTAQWINTAPDIQPVVWSAIVGRPTSSPAQIDSAVVKSHEHTNLPILERLGVNGSNALTLDGAAVFDNLTLVEW